MFLILCTNRDVPETWLQTEGPPWAGCWPVSTAVPLLERGRVDQIQSCGVENAVREVLSPLPGLP